MNKFHKMLWIDLEKWQSVEKGMCYHAKTTGLPNKQKQTKDGFFNFKHNHIFNIIHYIAYKYAYLLFGLQISTF